MLSNPWLESSLGRSVSTSTSSAEQIADRVLIFRAIQAAERVGAAGIGIRRRHAIERRFEVRDEPVVGRFGRTRAPRRRHRPRAQLAHHELPPLGIGTDVGDIERAEDEIPLLGFLVMTAGAIAIQCCLLRRYGSLRRLGGLSWRLFGLGLRVDDPHQEKQRKSDSAKDPTPIHSTSGLTIAPEYESFQCTQYRQFRVVAFCRKRLNLRRFLADSVKRKSGPPAPWRERPGFRERSRTSCGRPTGTCASRPPP